MLYNFVIDLSSIILLSDHCLTLEVYCEKFHFLILNYDTWWLNWRSPPRACFGTDARRVFVFAYDTIYLCPSLLVYIALYSIRSLPCCEWLKNWWIFPFIMHRILFSLTPLALLIFPLYNPNKRSSIAFSRFGCPITLCVRLTISSSMI